ncbi:MAG: hypothetical protein WDM86_22965 [Rhizomicrobium sp.]
MSRNWDGRGALAPVMRAFASHSNVIALERPAEPPAPDIAVPTNPAPAPRVAPADGLAEEQRVRLEILLAELQQLKARLKRA